MVHCFQTKAIFSLVLHDTITFKIVFYNANRNETIRSVLGTAQHAQDCPIFFIQLNYVHNNKEIRCCHLMLNYPATRWYWGFHFLFLNSAILHSCNFGHSCLYLLISPSILDYINYFCWIVLVCIYGYAFRHTICSVLGRATARQPNICKIPESSLYS